MRPRYALFLLLAPALVLCPPRCGYSQNAQDRWEQNVNDQLQIASAALRADGFVRTTTTYQDSIDQGSQQYMDVTLNAGVSYKFLGVCDQDCSDIDLTLRDGNGYLIDQDVDSDATPIVSVTPKFRGPFRLWIKMVSCSQEPCRWGVGIYIQQ